jgi:hypothetical protein
MTGKRLRVIPILLALWAGAISASWWGGTACHGQEAGLQDRLEKGLKARLPNEFSFISTVVTMVNNGQLPLDMVDSTFLWVRKNRSHKKYLVPYFERILRRRAEEKGINIP